MCSLVLLPGNDLPDRTETSDPAGLLPRTVAKATGEEVGLGLGVVTKVSANMGSRFWGVTSAMVDRQQPSGSTRGSQMYLGFLGFRVHRVYIYIYIGLI